MSQMNILIINCILTTAENGVIKCRKSIKDTMISNFAKGFIANGHSVTIVASEEFRPTEQEAYPYNIIFFKSRFPKIFKPHLIPWPIGLRKYLKENIDKFDMVVSSEAFAVATLMAADICKEKLVIWQEMAFHQKLFFHLPAKIWYNVVTRFMMTKAIVIPRSFPAISFIKKYAKNVTEDFVDHGADGEVLYPSDATDKTFVVISQLVARKNVGSIIRKFADLLKDDKYADYKLNIVGDGDESDNLKHLVCELGIGMSVQFYGFMRHADMAEMLRKAKAMLIDTHSDLNMVSIPESLISGTPVVSNMKTTTAEYIQQRGVGIAREEWGADDLKEIIENYDKYHKACLAVRDELTNVGCAKKMVRLFNEWIASKK